MNNWALKTLPVNKFGKEVVGQASQLLTNRSIQDVCNSICKKLESKSDLKLFRVTGLTGSGRTTFCKAVVKNLIQSHSLEESDVVYIKIDKNDNFNCVWNCGIQLARAKNLGNIAVILAAQSSTLEAKENAMVDVFDSFKVVCFDNLPISETNHQLHTLLMSIIQKVKTNVMCVSKPISPLPKYGTPVEVNGLNHAVIASDSNWQKTIQYLETSYKSIDKTIHLNPKAVQMLVNVSQVFGPLHYQKLSSNHLSSVLNVFNLIWEHLSDDERVVLVQLSELRRALPLKDAGVLSRVIRLGLVEYEPPGAHGNLFGEVILSDCVRDFVFKKKDKDKIMKTDSKFDVLQYWIMLLSEELVGLIEEARSNSWPFVPEKW
jgi:Cdc6-like AAA superfamily ATPase